MGLRDADSASDKTILILFKGGLQLLFINKYYVVKLFDIKRHQWHLACTSKLIMCDLGNLPAKILPP